MFTDQNYGSLSAQFPQIPLERIRSLCGWIAGLPDVKNPMAFAAKQLQRIAPQYDPATARNKPITPAARGTFREDGSWDSKALHASSHERQLRELEATIRRLRLTPATAVDLVFNAPCHAMFRMQSVAIWNRLDAAPQPCPGEHDAAAWLEAAWRNVATCTSAEAWLKACLCGQRGTVAIGCELPMAKASGDDAWYGE